MYSPNRLKSTDIITGDLANILLAYNDTLYQASPFLELAQNDLQGPSFPMQSRPSFPMITTPDRAPRGSYSLWPRISASRPSYATTPRSLAPSTPSQSLANLKMVSSPSPLSQVSSLCYPEISPPSQGSGSTPFERQFTSDFSRDWDNLDSQFSPIMRRSSDDPRQSSPVSSKAYDPSDSQESHSISQGVSLIDRFISAAADESGATEDVPSYYAFPSQERFSSPFSDLSDLTLLSSPEPPARSRRCITFRPGTPSESSNQERAVEPKNNICEDDDDEPDPNSEPETSLTRSSLQLDDQDYQPARGELRCKRKRAHQSSDDDELPNKRKKARVVSAPESTSTSADPSLETSTRRRLPSDVPYHPQFPLFYQRFPVSSHLRTNDGRFPLPTRKKLPGGTYNEPRDALDLYTPRFVKGCGFTKVGLCPICMEGPSRGGKGEAVWLSMKFSAYKCYHMQYAHGISSVSARPFSPPTVFRTIERQHPAKNERTAILEGKCHNCKKWIIVESIKNLDVKVKELYWWKHAAVCHRGTHIPGDDDFFLDDEIYRHVRTMESDPQP